MLKGISLVALYLGVSDAHSIFSFGQQHALVEKDKAYQDERSNHLIFPRANDPPFLNANSSVTTLAFHDSSLSNASGASSSSSRMSSSTIVLLNSSRIVVPQTSASSLPQLITKGSTMASSATPESSDVSSQYPLDSALNISSALVQSSTSDAAPFSTFANSTSNSFEPSSLAPSSVPDSLNSLSSHSKSPLGYNDATSSHMPSSMSLEADTKAILKSTPLSSLSVASSSPRLLLSNSSAPTSILSLGAIDANSSSSVNSFLMLSDSGVTSVTEPTTNLPLANFATSLNSFASRKSVLPLSQLTPPSISNTSSPTSFPSISSPPSIVGSKAPISEANTTFLSPFGTPGVSKTNSSSRNLTLSQSVFTSHSNQASTHAPTSTQPETSFKSAPIPGISDGPSLNVTGTPRPSRNSTLVTSRVPPATSSTPPTVNASATQTLSTQASQFLNASTISQPASSKLRNGEVTNIGSAVPGMDNSAGLSYITLTTNLSSDEPTASVIRNSGPGTISSTPTIIHANGLVAISTQEPTGVQKQTETSSVSTMTPTHGDGFTFKSTETQERPAFSNFTLTYGNDSGAESTQTSQRFSQSGPSLSTVTQSHGNRSVATSKTQGAQSQGPFLTTETIAYENGSVTTSAHTDNTAIEATPSASTVTITYQDGSIATTTQLLESRQEKTPSLSTATITYGNGSVSISTQPPSSSRESDPSVLTPTATILGGSVVTSTQSQETQRSLEPSVSTLTITYGNGSVSTATHIERNSNEPEPSTLTITYENSSVSKFTNTYESGQRADDTSIHTTSIITTITPSHTGDASIKPFVTTMTITYTGEAAFSLITALESRPSSTAKGSTTGITAQNRETGSVKHKVTTMALTYANDTVAPVTLYSLPTATNSPVSGGEHLSLKGITYTQGSTIWTTLVIGTQTISAYVVAPTKSVSGQLMTTITETETVVVDVESKTLYWTVTLPANAAPTNQGSYSKTLSGGSSGPVNGTNAGHTKSLREQTTFTTTVTVPCTHESCQRPPTTTYVSVCTFTWDIPRSNECATRSDFLSTVVISENSQTITFPVTVPCSNLDPSASSTANVLTNTRLSIGRQSFNETTSPLAELSSTGKPEFAPKILTSSVHSVTNSSLTGPTSTDSTVSPGISLRLAKTSQLSNGSASVGTTTIEGSTLLAALTNTSASTATSYSTHGISVPENSIASSSLSVTSTNRTPAVNPGASNASFTDLNTVSDQSITDISTNSTTLTPRSGPSSVLPVLNNISLVATASGPSRFESITPMRTRNGTLPLTTSSVASGSSVSRALTNASSISAETSKLSTLLSRTTNNATSVQHSAGSSSKWATTGTLSVPSSTPVSTSQPTSKQGAPANTEVGVSNTRSLSEAMVSKFTPSDETLVHKSPFTASHKTFSAPASRMTAIQLDTASRGPSNATHQRATSSLHTSAIRGNGTQVATAVTSSIEPSKSLGVGPVVTKNSTLSKPEPSFTVITVPCSHPTLCSGTGYILSTISPVPAHTPNIQASICVTPTVITSISGTDTVTTTTSVRCDVNIGASKTVALVSSFTNSAVVSVAHNESLEANNHGTSENSVYSEPQLKSSFSWTDQTQLNSTKGGRKALTKTPSSGIQQTPTGSASGSVATSSPETKVNKSLSTAKPLLGLISSKVNNTMDLASSTLSKTTITTTVTVPCTNPTCTTDPTSTIYTTVCSFTIPAVTGNECAVSTKLVSMVIVSENSRAITLPVTVPCDHSIITDTGGQSTTESAPASLTETAVASSRTKTWTWSSIVSAQSQPSTSGSAPTRSLVSNSTQMTVSSTKQVTSAALHSDNSLESGTVRSTEFEPPTFTVVTIPCSHAAICSRSSYILSTIYPASAASSPNLCITNTTFASVRGTETDTITTAVLCESELPTLGTQNTASVLATTSGTLKINWNQTLSTLATSSATEQPPVSAQNRPSAGNPTASTSTGSMTLEETSEVIPEKTSIFLSLANQSASTAPATKKAEIPVTSNEPQRFTGSSLILTLSGTASISKKPVQRSTDNSGAVTTIPSNTIDSASAKPIGPARASATNGSPRLPATNGRLPSSSPAHTEIASSLILHSSASRVTSPSSQRLSSLDISNVILPPPVSNTHALSSNATQSTGTEMVQPPLEFTSLGITESTTLLDGTFPTAVHTSTATSRASVESEPEPLNSSAYGSLGIPAKPSGTVATISVSSAPLNVTSNMATPSRSELVPTTFGPGGTIITTLTYSCTENICTNTYYTTVCSMTVPPTTIQNQCVSESTFVQSIYVMGHPSVLHIPVSIPCGSTMTASFPAAPTAGRASLTSPPALETPTFLPSSTPSESRPSSSRASSASNSTNSAVLVSTMLNASAPGDSASNSESSFSVAMGFLPTSSAIARNSQPLSPGQSSPSQNASLLAVSSTPATRTNSQSATAIYSTAQSTTSAPVASTSRFSSSGRIYKTSIEGLPAQTVVGVSNAVHSSKNTDSVVPNDDVAGIPTTTPAESMQGLRDMSVSGISTIIAHEPATNISPATQGPDRSAATTVVLHCTDKTCVESDYTTVCSIPVPPTATFGQCITESTITSTVTAIGQSTEVIIPVMIPCDNSGLTTDSASYGFASISRISATEAVGSQNATLGVPVSQPATRSRKPSATSRFPHSTQPKPSTEAPSAATTVPSVLGDTPRAMQSFASTESTPRGRSQSEAPKLGSRIIAISSEAASEPTTASFVASGTHSTNSQPVSRSSKLTNSAHTTYGPGATFTSSITLTCTGRLCQKTAYTTVCEFTVPSTTTVSQCITVSTFTTEVSVEGQPVSTVMTLPVSIPCGSEIASTPAQTNSTSKALETTPAGPAQQVKASTVFSETHATQSFVLKTSKNPSNALSERIFQSSEEPIKTPVVSTSGRRERASVLSSSRNGPINTIPGQPSGQYSGPAQPIDTHQPSGAPQSGPIHPGSTTQAISPLAGILQPNDTSAGLTQPSRESKQSTVVSSALKSIDNSAATTPMPATTFGPGQAGLVTVAFSCTKDVCEQTAYTTVCAITVPSTSVANQCVSESTITSTVSMQGHSSTVLIPVSIPCESTLSPKPAPSQLTGVSGSGTQAKSLTISSSRMSSGLQESAKLTVPGKTTQSVPLTTPATTFSPGQAGSTTETSSGTKVANHCVTESTITRLVTANGHSSVVFIPVSILCGSTISSEQQTSSVLAPSNLTAPNQAPGSMPTPLTSKPGQPWAVITPPSSANESPRGTSSDIHLASSILAGSSSPSKSPANSTQIVSAPASLPSSEFPASSPQTSSSQLTRLAATQLDNYRATTSAIQTPCAHSDCAAAVSSSSVHVNSPTPTESGQCMTTTRLTSHVVISSVTTKFTSVITLPCGSTISKAEISSPNAISASSSGSTSGSSASAATGSLPVKVSVATSIVEVPCTTSKCIASVISTPVHISIPTPTESGQCMTTTMYTSKVVVSSLTRTISSLISLPCGSSIHETAGSSQNASTRSQSESSSSLPAMSPIRLLSSLVSSSGTYTTATSVVEIPCTHSQCVGTAVATPIELSTPTSTQSGQCMTTTQYISEVVISSLTETITSLISLPCGASVSEDHTAQQTSSQKLESTKSAIAQTSSIPTKSPPLQSSSSKYSQTPSTADTSASSQKPLSRTDLSAVAEIPSSIKLPSSVQQQRAGPSSVPGSESRLSPYNSSAMSTSSVSLGSSAPSVGSSSSSLASPTSDKPSSPQTGNTASTRPESTSHTTSAAFQETAAQTSRSWRRSPASASVQTSKDTYATIPHDAASSLTGMVLTTSSLSPATSYPTSELTYMTQHGSSTLLEAPEPTKTSSPLIPQEATINSSYLNAPLSESPPQGTSASLKIPPAVSMVTGSIPGEQPLPSLADYAKRNTPKKMAWLIMPACVAWVL